MAIKIVKNGNRTEIHKLDESPLRILHLTDIHIGGGVYSKKYDKLALEAVRKIVTKTNPDFVIVTGDISYPYPVIATTNNEKSARMLADLMKELNVNWTLCFGNHDAEHIAKLDRNQLADVYMSYDNCYFDKGDKSIFGVGNYCIPVFNSDNTFSTALMLIDSNSYLTKNFKSGFDVIHEDQIVWYENTIKNLKNEFNLSSLPKSLAFYHIPPKEFKEAWDKCYLGSNEVIYHHGFVQEKDNYFGYPKQTEGKFFDRMVKLGSCNGMFMGHDHLNTVSLTYKGIRLSYGMSIDYFAYLGIIKKITQRGGSIISINNDGSFDLTLVPLTSCD